MELVGRPSFGQKVARFSTAHRRSMRVWVVSQAVAIAVSVAVTTALIVDEVPVETALSNTSFYVILVRTFFAGITLVGIAAGGLRECPQRHKEVEACIALDYVAGGLVALGFTLGVALVNFGVMLIVGGTGFLCFLLLWTFLLIQALSPRGPAAGAVRGVTLLTTLHERGYDWVTSEDARHLWELCGEAAFTLPPWEEVGTLPGVAEGDLESLKGVLKLRREVLSHG